MRLNGQAEMEGQGPEIMEETFRPETPEDVAVLFTWANLKGARYRDFSASRREYRAQMRHRAAQAKREAEARAKVEAEEAASAAERGARQAEEAARFHAAQARLAAERQRDTDVIIEQAAKERALQHAEQLSRQAASARIEAARHAQALRSAEIAVRREAMEMAEAHASAERKAERYEAAQFYLGTQQTGSSAGESELETVYSDPQPASVPIRPAQTTEFEDNMLPARFPQRRSSLALVPLRHADSSAAAASVEDSKQTEDQRTTGASPARLYYEPNATETATAVDQYARFMSSEPCSEPIDSTERELEEAIAELPSRRHRTPVRNGAALTRDSDQFQSGGAGKEAPIPSWIETHTSASQSPLAAAVSSPVDNTLQHSRERVASRWYALKGVFDPATPEMEPTESRAREGVPPILAIFSIAGGVGKTSLAASLARALAAQGERVLLTDTTSHGVLPYYFGATEIRAGVVRTFSPPPGSTDEAIHLISYDLARREGETGLLDDVGQRLTRDSKGFGRVVVDLCSSATAVVERLVGLGATVLVPVGPDMNSIISLGTVDRLFAGMSDPSGRPVTPRFLLTQFEASLPLQVDIREVMQRKLEERLLPFVIRRSPAVAEALAEGMTVIDYMPQEGIAKDYLQLAAWVRTLTAPAKEGLRSARWSER